MPRSSIDGERSLVPTALPDVVFTGARSAATTGGAIAITAVTNACVAAVNLLYILLVVATGGQIVSISTSFTFTEGF